MFGLRSSGPLGMVGLCSLSSAVSSPDAELDIAAGSRLHGFDDLSERGIFVIGS